MEAFDGVDGIEGSLINQTQEVERMLRMNWY
jgi:hypothetical protein